MNKPRIHKKADGYLLVLPTGQCRYLNLWEVFWYLAMNRVPHNLLGAIGWAAFVGACAFAYGLTP